MEDETNSNRMSGGISQAQEVSYDWYGDVEFDGGYVYLMRDGNLYGATITEEILTSELQLIPTGGRRVLLRLKMGLQLVLIGLFR